MEAKFDSMPRRLVLLPVVVLLLLLAQARPRGAPPAGFLVESSPTGARVLLSTVDVEGLRQVPVGVTPGPLRMGPEQLPATLVLELPGYEPLVVHVPRGGVPRVSLVPRVAVVVPLLYSFRDWPFLWVAALVAAYWGRCFADWRRVVRTEARTLTRLVLGDLGPGVPVGPYVLGERLGGGGMARVFEARRRGEADGEVLALKVLDDRSARDPSFLERFRREVNATRSLAHPCVVPLLDWGEAGGHLYIVMERVPGETLAARLDRGGVSVADAVRWGRDVAEALAAAHARGVVHRDVKPANVMITPQGRARLMDFGIALRTDLPGLTEAGHVMGTPAYLAPEQVRGLSVDWRADLYALGMTLYETLSGAHPYDAATLVDLMARHVSGEPRPLGEVRPDVPPGLAALVHRLLSKDPAQRASRPGDVAEELEALEAAL